MNQPLSLRSTPIRTDSKADGTGFRLLIVLTVALLALGTAMWVDDSESLAICACVGGLVVLIAFKLDYLHPAVAYVTPWLTILLFSTIPISEYARSLDPATCRFLLTTIFVWLAATIAAPVMGSDRKAQAVLGVADPPPKRLSVGIFAGFTVLYLFATFNVAYAGYIPIVALFRTGDSGYASFGIPSVYGAFLAYSNAMACLALYGYLRERRRSYLLLFWSVFLMHVALVSRQNLVTLLVEGFVLRCLVVGRVSRVSIVAFIALGLAGFSALGELRTGNIANIVRVTPGFAWLPNGLLWLYAYSYFNVLNLDNTFNLSGAPFYDGSMWQNLLPSVLRPDIDHGTYLEVEALNVSSYIYPIYLDVGAAGVLVWTAAWGWITSYFYRRALRRARFVDVATYACLFGCAVLSFFTDFWFYLPVIFQVVFFRIFHLALFRTPRAGAAGAADGLLSPAGGS